MKNGNIMILLQQRIRVRIFFFMLVTDEIMGDDSLKYINAGHQLRALADDFEARRSRRRIAESFKEPLVPCRFRMVATAVAIVALTYCIFSDGLPGEFHVWS